MRVEIIYYQNDFFRIRIQDICQIIFSSAQSKAVRCSRTLTWCLLPRGSTKANILHVPFLTYSESIFCSSPGRIGNAPLHLPAIATVSHPYTQLVFPDCKAVHIRQGCLPCRLWIRHRLLTGCTSSCCSEVEIGFFKVLRMASRLTGVSRMILDFSSGNRSIHLEWPSGTGPQVSSMIRASARPSSIRPALSEFTLHLNVVSSSMPPWTYFFTVLVTVAKHTPFDLADCSCVSAFPWASSRSIIIWHLQRIVFGVLAFRIIDFNFFNSSSVSSILYSLGLAIRNHCRFFLFIMKQQ